MATATAPLETFAEDQVLRLDPVRWAQYVVINDTLGERPRVRMIYLNGRLTLVSPSRRHNWYGDLFDAIIKAVATGCGILWETAGSATYRSEELNVGVEADQTYYFGDHAEIMGGPVNIDLTTQPPPDLALEVEYTNSSDDSMVIYDRLGVPEVWRYHVKRAALIFLRRRPEGGYEAVATSVHLPMLAPDDVLGQLRLAEQTRPTSIWAAQLAGWVRDVILPRVADRG